MTYRLKNMFFSVVVLFFACCQNKDSNVLNKASNGSEVKRVVEHFPSRDQMLSRLANNNYDVLIVGGGATGSGALLDASSRGLKAILIERYDFSAGTSSKSTKLVHGGVRYLENAVKKFDIGQYHLVREALDERQHFLSNAPHLSMPLAIITPVYSWFDAIYYWMGLKVYDLISGNGSLAPSEFISKELALSSFPILKTENLKGAVVYYDGQFDDARMNLGLILSSIREGADAINYMGANDFIKDKENKIIGVMATDNISGKPVKIFSKVVINATGPYADFLRKKDNKEAESIMVSSQGTHILLGANFSAPKMGMIIPKTKDGRVLFVLPWQGKTIAGTTDIAKDITDTPTASEQEVEYILEHLKEYFSVPIKREEVLATWSGLRPLVKPISNTKDTASISRDHFIEITPSNLITIVGGKWTTYRKMAEDVIDRAIEIGSLSPKNNCVTKNLKIFGADNYKESLVNELQTFEQLPNDIASHLVSSYGDRVDVLIEIDNKSKTKRLIDNYPFIEAEVIYAIRHEYALTPMDVIARRIRLAFLDYKASLLALPKIVSLMGNELKWSPEKLSEELKKGYEFLDTMYTK